MNYRQDKKKNNKRIVYFAIVAIFIFTILFFSTVVFSSAQFAAQAIFKPFMSFRTNALSRISSWGSYFDSKKSLLAENQELKEKNLGLVAELSNYDILLAENKELKEILVRTEGREFILGNILVKPNQSIYDTFVVDAGSNHGVQIGAKVFANGYIPIGLVTEVNNKTSKITLYSTSKERTSVIVSSTGTNLEVVGRGMGNFEMTLPRDFEILAGEEVYLPGSPYALASVEGIISDPRDSFKKALLRSPVNLFDLRFVEIEK